MGIKGIDPWVIVAGDLQRTLDFYKGLGFTIVWEKRPGRPDMATIRIDDAQKINVHGPDAPARPGYLGARRPTAGGADFCLEWDGTVDDILALLKRNGVGPKARARPAHALKAQDRVRVYPVTPNYDEIMGVKSYASVADLPEGPDLVAVVVPYHQVLDVLEACHAKGAGSAIVISAGFAERGEPARRDLQTQLGGFARDTGLRLSGPNCLGLANVKDDIWATSSSRGAKGVTGPVGLVCQSGATAFGPFLARAADAGVGFSYIISTGNEADLDCSDFARYLLDDAATRVIAGFVEGFKDASKFLEVAKLAAERGKPLVMIKIGRSEAGARAARSHTAALTGVDKLYDAGFAQYLVIASAGADTQAEQVISLRQRTHKGIAFLWTGSRSETAGLAKLKLANIPMFYTPDTLARGLRCRLDYHAWRDRRLSDGFAEAPALSAGQHRAIARLRAAGRTTLSESESKQLIAAWGIPVTREVLASSAKAAVEAAERLGYPVALKVDSPDIPHTTEAGAVRLGPQNAGDVGRAYTEIVASALAHAPDATVSGVLVQEMVAEGVEVIIGVSYDAQLGPMLLFGTGGVMVEVYDDVAMRRCPLTLSESLAMLSEVKGARLLRGFRGRPPADVAALAHTPVPVSWLAAHLTRHLAEPGIHPLMVLPAGRGVKAVDALAVLPST